MNRIQLVRIYLFVLVTVALQQFNNACNISCIELFVSWYDVLNGSQWILLWQMVELYSIMWWYHRPITWIPVNPYLQHSKVINWSNNGPSGILYNPNKDIKSKNTVSHKRLRSMNQGCWSYVPWPPSHNVHCTTPTLIFRMTISAPFKTKAPTMFCIVRIIGLGHGLFYANHDRCRPIQRLRCTLSHTDCEHGTRQQFVLYKTWSESALCNVEHMAGDDTLHLTKNDPTNSGPWKSTSRTKTQTEAPRPYILLAKN